MLRIAFEEGNSFLILAIMIVRRYKILFCNRVGLSRVNFGNTVTE